MPPGPRLGNETSFAVCMCQQETPLEVSTRDGTVVIEPATVPMRLVRERGFLVVKPEVPLPPLTDELVRETLESIRFRR